MTAAMSAARVLVVLAGILALALPTRDVRAADGASATEKKPAVAAKNKRKNARNEAAEPPTTVEALKERIEGEDVRGFRTFCDTWMRKLADRTTRNAANIVWNKGGAGVVGEYVRYGTDRTCIAKEEPGKVPIGKITYRETTYRKEGVSEAVAQNAAETIVEQTDVTEIFRFAKGRWQY
jgi:hypothetical protein